MPISFPPPVLTAGPWLRALITDTAGLNVDVSGLIQSADITWGRTDPTQATVSASQASCVFDDTTGTLDPDNATSPLHGKLAPRGPSTLRLDHYVTELGAYVPIFTGYIDSLERTFTGGAYSQTSGAFLDQTVELARHVPPAGTALPQELSGARISRLLSTSSRSGFMWVSRSRSAPTALDTGQKMLGSVTCDGSTSSWTYATQAAQAEDGLLYFNPAGQLVFQGQQRRLTNVPAWTFSDSSGQIRYENDLTLRLSSDNMVSDAAVTTVDGVTSVYGPGGASQVAAGVTVGLDKGNSIDLTETSALAGWNSGASRAQHLYASYGQGRRNVPTVSLFAAPFIGQWTVGGSPSVYQTAVKVGMSDLVTLIRTPHQGSTITFPCWVEGGRLTIDSATFTQHLNLSRADPIPSGGYWVLGVSRLGINTTLTW